MSLYFVETPNKQKRDGSFDVATGIYPNGTEDLNGAISEAYGCMLWDNYPTYAQTENGLVRLPKSRVVDDHKNVIHEFF